MQTQKSILLIIFLCVISCLARKDVAQPSLRATLSKNQLMGEPTVKAASISRSWIINTMRSFSRLSVYSVESNSVSVTTAGKEPVIESTSINQNQKLIAWLQGVGFFAMFGVSFLIVALIWSCFVFCCSCICCCKNCCGKKLEVIDAEFRKEDYVEWEKSYFVRVKRVKICRFLIVFAVLITTILLIVWAVFAYQVNLDVSNTVDNAVNVSNNVQDFVEGSVAKIGNLSSNANDVGFKVESFVTTILGLLPNATTIDGYKGCVSRIISSLPNVTRIEAIIDSAYLQLNRMPNIELMRNNTKTIQNRLNYLRYVDLDGAYSRILFANITLITLPNSMDGIRASLATYDTSLANLPNLTRAVDIVDALEAPLTSPLTNSFMSTLSNNLRLVNKPTPAHDSPATTRTQLTTFKTGIQQLQATNISLLINILQQMNTTIVGLPPVANLSAQLTSINASLASLNVKAIGNHISSMNATINLINGLVNNITSSINLIKNITGSIPSMSGISAELNKINQTVVIMNCIDRIIADVININETVLILASSVSDTIRSINNSKKSVKDIDLSSVTNSTNSVNKTVNEDIPRALARFDSFNFTNTMRDMPNMNSLQNTSNNADVTFESAKNALNISRIMNQIANFSSTLATKIPDLSVHITPLKNLNNSIQSISVNNVDIVLTYLQDGACGATLCAWTDADIKTQACVALANLIDNLASSAAGRPSRAVINGNLNQAQNSINSFPNMKTLISQVDSAKQNLTNIPSFSSSLSQIRSANSSLDSVASMPFDDFDNQMRSAQDNFNAIPSNSSMKSSLNSAKSSLNQVQDTSSIDSIFDNMKNALNSVNASTFVSPFISSITSFTTQTNVLDRPIATFEQYKEQYLTQVYTYDGYRLLVTLIIIILFVPFPLVALCACCCPRRPCPLLCLSNIYNVIVIISCIVIGVFLPVNILLGDTCPVVETTAIKAAETVFPSIASTRIEQNVAIMGASINISIVPLQIVREYTSECTSNSAVSSIINQTKSAISTITGSLDQYLTIPIAGFKLHPKVFQNVGTLKTDLLGIIFGIIDNLSNIIQCTSINPLYKQIKSVVCDTADLLALNLWFMAFLLLLILFFNSCFNSCAYCCLYRNWTPPNPQFLPKPTTVRGPEQAMATQGVLFYATPHGVYPVKK